MTFPIDQIGAMRRLKQANEIKRREQHAMIELIQKAIWHFSWHQCEFGHNTEPDISDEEIKEWLEKKG